MNERVAELRGMASAEREKLSESFDSLQEELRDLTDWRTVIRRDPETAMVIALGTGFVIGVTSRSKGARGRPTSAARVSQGRGASAVSVLGSDVWREVRSIALQLLAGKVASLLGARQSR